VKKIAVCLALFFVVGGLASAQSDLANFKQEGKATWETVSGGLWAAHPTLPIGSTPTVRNTATGREIEVTVVGQIPESQDRIVDISTEVARAIGLEPDGTVLLYFPSGSTNKAADGQQSQNGVNIVIHNHVIPQSALPLWMDAVSQGLSEPGGSQAQSARVTPGIPDPRNGKVYRLQVGSWGNADSAFDAFRRLRDANFNAIYEFINGSYAVYAGGILSPDVSTNVSNLGRMGFMDIHVWEQ
jgi:hypothetical protein